MKINHTVIRESLKWIAFGIFAVSVYKKLKAIVIHGGTKPISDPNEQLEEKEEAYDMTDAEEPVCETESKY